MSVLVIMSAINIAIIRLDHFTVPVGMDWN